MINQMEGEKIKEAGKHRVKNIPMGKPYVFDALLTPVVIVDISDNSKTGI